MGRESNKKRRERQANSAREKAAAARLARQRVEQRQRAQRILSGVLVAVLVVAFVAYIAIHHTKSNNAAGNRKIASPAVVKAVGAVDDATLQTVGTGTTKPLLPKKVSDPPLTANGLPDLLFVGAEFCPYCAAERWPLIEALDRFGTFSGLDQVSSSSSDVFANTPSFSFLKAHYTSKYLAFSSVEAQDRSHHTLQTPSKSQLALWVKYTGDPPGFPFLDFGGKYVQTAQSFSPQLLDGLTQAKIAAQLNTPTSAIAKAIDGSANVTTATICTMTNNEPANVCLVPAITTLQSQLNA